MKPLLTILLLICIIGCTINNTESTQNQETDFNYDGTGFRTFSDLAVTQAGMNFDALIKKYGSVKSAVYTIAADLFESIADEGLPVYAPGGGAGSFNLKKDKGIFKLHYDLPGDLNSDYKVNHLDLDILIKAFEEGNHLDLNRDMMLDVHDLIFLLGRYLSRADYYYIYTADGQKLLQVFAYSPELEFIADYEEVLVVIKDQNRASRVEDICDKADEWISKISGNQKSSLFSKNSRADFTQQVLAVANDMMNLEDEDQEKLYTWYGKINSIPSSAKNLPEDELEEIFKDNIITLFPDYNMNTEEFTVYDSDPSKRVWEANGGYDYEHKDSLLECTTDNVYNFLLPVSGCQVNLNLGEEVVKIFFDQEVFYNAIVLRGTNTGKPHLMGFVESADNSNLTNYDIIFTRIGPGDPQEPKTIKVKDPHTGEFELGDPPAGDYKVQLEHTDGKVDVLENDWVYVPKRETPVDGGLKRKHNFKSNRKIVWDIHFHVTDEYFGFDYQVDFDSIKIACFKDNMQTYEFGVDDGAIAPYKFINMYGGAISDTLICMTNDEGSKGTLDSFVEGSLHDFNDLFTDSIGVDDSDGDGYDDYLMRVNEEDYEPPQLRILRTRDESVTYGTSNTNTLEPNHVYLEFHLTDLLTFDWKYQDSPSEPGEYDTDWHPSGIVCGTAVDLINSINPNTDLFDVSQLTIEESDKIFEGKPFTHNFTYEYLNSYIYQRNVDISFTPRFVEDK